MSSDVSAQATAIDNKSKKSIDVSKYSLVPTPLSTAQVLKIFSRTPKQYIYTRPAKGGGVWKYVKPSYIQKILNYVFGFLWSFEIRETKQDHGQVTVLGRLTINWFNPQTNQIEPMMIKEQWGRADIKYRKDTLIALDYGNDFKAATSDAFKKCASQLGIASDVYAAEEFKDISDEVDGDQSGVANDQIDDIQKEALRSLGIDWEKSKIQTKAQALEAIEKAKAKKGAK